MFLRFVFLTLLTSLAILQSPRSVEAVPASPMLHSVTQPDGTGLNVRQWGDERVSGFESEDGYTAIMDEGSKFWYYANIATDGSLQMTALRVGIDSPPAHLTKHLRPNQSIIIQQQEIAPSGKQLGKTVAAIATAVSGTKNIPVILTNFSNTSFTYTTNDFSALIFGTGNFSMKDYFQEVSYNSLTVAPGSSGVVGPVTVLKTHDYYGQDINGAKDYYSADLVYEAVSAADSSINFAEYSTNNSCNVENVVIVHQGKGQEASPFTTDIWSKQWNLSAAKYFGRMNAAYPGTYITNDPCPSGGYMKVNTFTVQPEINSDGGMITIGVIAHEFGHVLGLPDLYDTQKLDPVNSGGAGDWSLMASGSYGTYLRSGDRPSHLDAWSKYKLGWITPTQVTSSLTNESITAASFSADVYQLLSGSPDSGEYFLVENRQKTGFDIGLPSSGLLIWHIDGSEIYSHLKTNDVNNFQCYPPNDCTTNHYGVSIVQADGNWGLEKNLSRGDAGDPFPGTYNNTSFSGTTNPNSYLWSGALSSVAVTNISASSQTMTATLSVNACSYNLPLSSSVSQSAASSGTFQLISGAGCSWSAASNAAWLTISSSLSGTGSSVITFAVAANTTSVSRQGTITAGGKTYTITQAATATGSGTFSILQNEDFELGQVNWAEYSSGNFSIIGTRNVNHGGYWSASFAGYNSAYENIRQTITIPSGIAQASLSFWYLITTKETSTVTKYDTLSVLLLDQYDSSYIIANLGTLSNLDAPSIYKQTITLDLTPYKGRTLQLAFLASTDFSSPTKFVIDDISLTTSSTATVSVTPTQRLFAASSGQTGSISVTGTGVWTATSDSSWVTILSGANGTNGGTVSYAVAQNTTPTLRKAQISIADKTITIIQAGVSGIQDLVTNGGFESGSFGWSNYSAGNYVVITNSLSYFANSGSYYAWMGGYNNASDMFWQPITIPATSSDVFLQYNYSVSSTETSTVTEYDRLYVYLTDPVTGSIIDVLKSYSNLNSSSYWNKSDAIDLSSYKGQTVNIVFSASTDILYTTSFLLDNIEVKAFTDNVAPNVVSVLPAENATNIALSSSISCSFSKQINPSTLGSASFIVSDGNGTVPGAIVYDSSTLKATFTPFTPLTYGKAYTVSLLNSITDFSGNTLTAMSWTFTTINPPTYTVSFNSNGGSTVSSQSIVFGGSAALPTSPTRTGYTFAGWYSDVALASAFSFTKAITADTSLYAKWTALPAYKVTYSGNGNTSGTIPEDNNTYLQGATTKALNNIGSLYKTGSVFAGWNTASSGSGDNYAEAATLFIGSIDITLYAVYLDVTAPVLIVSTLGGKAFTTSATLKISGNVSDNVSVKTISCNGQTATVANDGTFIITVTLVAGANTITTIATDNANNQTTDIRTITLDTTAPVLTVSAPADNSKTAQPLATITGTINETSTVTVKLNSGSPQNASITESSYSAEVIFASGLNSITVTATDLAGNTTSVVRSVTYDNTKPSLSILNPAQDISTTQSVLTISGSVADTITITTINITVDGQSYAPTVATDGSFSQTINLPSDKTYAVVVTATDQAGNTTTSQRNIIKTSIAATGDITGDGKVDIADALKALRIAIGLDATTPALLLLADVAPLAGGTPAPDGVVDIADALVVLEKAVGLVSW